MKRLLPPAEVRLVMDELHELHVHWTATKGRPVADRRYLQQLRRYPSLLLARRMSRFHASRQGLMPFRGLFHGARSLAKVPALTAAIVATVGIGIGGCTAIFAVIDVLFLRPLPYPDADRLQWVFNDAPQFEHPFSVADFNALQEGQTSFDGVAGYTYQELTFTSPERAVRIPVAAVTPGYLELLGIDLQAGRPPLPDEGHPGAEPTVVITPGFANRYLGLSSTRTNDALGQVVKLGGNDFQVIGILHDDFGPLNRWAEAFTTLRLEEPTRKGPFFLRVYARLRDGIDPTLAEEELRALNSRLFPLWAESYQDEDTTWAMEPVRKLLQGDVDRLLVLLMGSVGLLLLTATANAANLLLARIGGRRREMAVRSAMGASRGRIVGHLLTESILLAVGGVALGLLLAHWAFGLLPNVASGYIPRLSELRLSGPVLGFAGSLALASGLLFGLISAIQGSGGDLGATLRSGGRTATQGAKQQRVQRVLVVGQLALAMPLRAGAGLLLSSFSNLYRSDLGFDVHRLVSVTVPLDQSRYPDPATRTAFWEEASRSVSAIPGVQAMGIGTGRPPATLFMTNNFDLEDYPTPPGGTQPAVPWIFVNNGYFQTLGIPHLAGRLFEASDQDEDAPPVIVVDEAWANRFFPGEEVLGRRLRSGGCTTCPFTTVVGVVGTVPYQGVRSSHQGAVYGSGVEGYLTSPILQVRASGDPALLVPRIREEIRRIDPEIPLADFSTGETLLRESLSQPRHLSFLLTSFSTVAMILAVVGLYGIMAYTVQRKRSEIAIRLALGGTQRDVLLMVIRQGMTLVGIGLANGTVGALAFTGVLSDLLFEVEPRDPLTLVGVAVLLAGVSLLACALPGRRAVSIDPASTLQEE